MSTDQLVAQYLEQLRLRLLDLSGRNRLLNFKFSERSRTQVRFVDRLPDQTFEKLEKGNPLTIASLPEPPEHPVDEDDDAFRLLLEAMRDSDSEYMAAVASLDEVDHDSEEFQQIERKLRDKVREELAMPPRTDTRSLSKLDYARHLEINPDYELPTLQPKDSGKPAHWENSLQTLLYPDELERKLAGLREGARKSLQETGLNTLYLAFGMLEWYESDQSDKRLLAPLLLYPVTLERQLRRGQYYYTVISCSEEPEENFSLRERLKQDFGIVLPAFTTFAETGGQATDTPETYFEKIRQVIRDRSRWRVRRFLNLSLFSFGGIALFQDLNPERWPANASILKHPLVSSVLCGQNEVSQDTIAPDYEVDHPSIANKVPLLITDADTSQFSAIVDAIDGKNLVIEGPPGTGKSQTITNLIAAALAKGKTVLFVAEKKAALEVVYNRLADAGLENYCLEVHSTASSKQFFYERLKQRVEQKPPLSVLRELEVQVQEHNHLKELLSRYVLLLNQPFGKIGKTIQELLWAAQRANDLISGITVPSMLANLRDDQAATMTETDFRRKYEELKEFSQQHQELIQKYGQVTNHPWFGLTAHDLSPIDQGDLLSNAKIWVNVLQDLQSNCKQIICTLGIDQQPTIVELSKLQKQLTSYPEISSLIEAALLPTLTTAQAQNSTALLIERLKDYRQTKRALNKYFKNEPTSLPEPSLLENLLESLKTIKLDNQEYTIDELKELGQQAAETSFLLEQYQPIVSQVASFFDLDFHLSINDIEAIAAVVDILSEQSPNTLAMRTPELCNPSNQVILIKAKQTWEKLNLLHTNLRQKYRLESCTSFYRMEFYGNKMRNANFLTHWFDSEYRQAKKLWMEIQKQPKDLPDSEIAEAFEKIADFQKQLDSFNQDFKLREICGSYFRELETDFNALLAINSFGISANQLSTDSFGKRLAAFLVKADINKLDKVSRLQNSGKFQSLLNFIGSIAMKFKTDKKLNWDELIQYYREKASIASHVYEKLNKFGLQTTLTTSVIPDLINEIKDHDCAKQEIRASDPFNVLGYFYQAEHTDLERLEATLNFAKSVLQSQLPQPIQKQLLTIDVIRIAETIQFVLQNLSNYLEQEMKYRQGFLQGKVDSQAMFGSRNIDDLTLQQLIQRINGALEASGDLPAWINYHRAYQKLVDDGLQPLVEAFEFEKLTMDKLGTTYPFVFYRSLLRFAYQQHPELNQFSGVSQAQARDLFQQMDKKLLSLYQKQLVAQLAEVSIAPGNSRGRRSEWTDLALIRNEISKQRRHISQRDLFKRASTALQQLKPCWMMSPASVAQFIPPGVIDFDMVIIDEASQMRPEEALGSIARAKQLIVVGDPKQLPPTSFFKSQFISEGNEGDEGESDVLDDESILDMSLKVFYPARRLKWHYRSRHESLIAFSNHHFYSNSLTIFPSPDNQFAVEYRYVEEGAYRSGANIPEAMSVAKAAAEFMKLHPNLSLGIVTLNQKQQELLLDEMDRLFALHPDLEQYRMARENTLEPFFIKNLENVQGDERDVIFISTVYGPERPGMPVMQRFGPINSRSGHRRLNVLFTRAKERVVVFSSMKSSDIRPSPTSNQGVQILKEYLEYAQTQRLQTALLTGKEPDSDFEVFVAERLRQRGYQVVPQVGVSGYFIDLAVVDPQRSGTYLLGIECDGATYHSSKSARDRDRLRQQVLERLGWKLYRIWSTDWFMNTNAEFEKLIRHIQTLSY
uniref:RAP domain-containing protein n=1 Tax=Cyanothece sp. (strain PCC 7425 / ATCC 29141) TaxID=395961 RepID=B8HN08_CYAP4